MQFQTVHIRVSFGEIEQFESRLDAFEDEKKNQGDELASSKRADEVDKRWTIH